MKLVLRVAVGAALVVAPLSIAWAYSVQPMIYSLTPSGSGSSVRLTVANSREGQLNVEIQPFAVTADDAGKRTFTPSTNDFLIFPPQASIAGDRSQLFQIRYVGSPQLGTGRVYVLRVHQTNTIEAVRPDAPTGPQTRLAMSLNFNTTAIVQPKEMQSGLAVERDLVADATGTLHARLINRGPGVADLTRMAWSLDRGGKSEPLAIQNIKYGDAIFVEPGRSRDITLSATIKGPARLVATAPEGSRGSRKP
jgi:P pilus assembly chaperone PapD